MGQFSNSFPKHFSYLCEYAIRFDLSCSFCEYPFIFHCLQCSPTCFDPDSLLLAYLWLGLSWIYCISASKSFSSSKTSSRKPYTSSKQQERHNHSVEITINVSQEGDRRATGRRQGGDRETTGKRQETRHSDRISDRKAKGRRQEGNRASGDREATGKRQEKETGERQESDRRATGERKGFFLRQEGDRKATGRRQGCDRRATGLWKTTSETK